MPFRFVRPLLLTALGLLSAAPALAQTAQITGRITDASAAVLPGATVVVMGEQIGLRRTATSNHEGYYSVPFLPLGTYEIAVECPGFRPARRRGITLSVDQVVRVDFSLEVGGLTQEVTVEAKTPRLETETSSLGQVIETRAIVDLPLNGRNYLQLAKLAAGVVEPPPGDRAAAGGAFAANGVRSTLNSFILDGVDNNSRIVDIQNSSNVVIQPSVDAIAEFKVQTHSFSAEYGQAAGAVVNAVIRSGTNEFRGTAYEFHRNSALDARNYFARPEDDKPSLRRHQFGATFGGPLARDRMFFFASWERTRETRGLTFLETVPTEAMRRGDFSGERSIFDPATVRANPAGPGFVRDPFPGNVVPSARIDPVAARLLELLPRPNLPGSFNNYSTTANREDRRDQVDVRLDFSASPASKLFGRVSFMDGLFSNPGPFPPPLVGSDFFQQSEKEQRAVGVALGETHILSGQSVNELRLGYSRIRDNLAPFVKERLVDELGIRGIPDVAGITGLPQIAVSGFASLGEASFLPNLKISETFQASDNLSLLRGRHSLKVGFAYRFVRSVFDVSGQARGVFSFSNAFTRDPQNPGSTGSAMADFLLGITSSAQLSTTFEGDLRNHYLGLYVQDDWKLTPRLTLNLGLRYELFTHPYETGDRQANFLLDERRLVYPGGAQPAGFPAELVTGVPAGVSARSLLKPDRNNLAPRLGLAYRLGEPTVVRAAYGLFYADHPAVGASGRLVGNPPFQRVRTVPTDQIHPGILLASGFPAGFLDEVEFSALTAFRSWALDFTQAYVHHWNLDVQQDFGALVVDLGYTGSHGERLPMSFDVNSPRPGPGAVAERRPFQGFGSIGRVEPIGESDYHALQVKVERRFSRGFGFLAAYTFGKAIDLGGEQLNGQDQLYRDVQNLGWERSLSLFDVRHRLVLSYLWELPFGAGRRFPLGSGLLEAVLGNWQLSGITTIRSGSPFTPSLGVSSANTGHPRPDRLGDGNLPAGERSVQRWFDVTAFAVPPAFEFGDAGKNILIGPGAVNTDLSLSKRIPFRALGRQSELQLRIEAYNVFNTPQFANPNPRVDLPAGGTITALASNMRELQVGLKLVF